MIVYDQGLSAYCILHTVYDKIRAVHPSGQAFPNPLQPLIAMDNTPIRVLLAKVGLDALLKGECSVISGKSNRQMAFLPHLLPRRRAVAMVGQAWKKRLQSRGISV